MLPGYLSSSEYEEEEDLDEIMSVPHVQLPSKKDEQVYTLVRWFVIFIRLWQIMFSISDTAIKILLSCFLQIIRYYNFFSFDY